MTRPCTVVCLILSAMHTSTADANVVLSGSHPPGNPLVMVPSSVSSAQMDVTISQAISPESTDEALAGWQVTLRVEPDIGSAGTVRFHSVSEGNDYIFSSVDNFGVVVNPTLPPLPNDELLVFDFNYPYSGGVPLSPEDAPRGLLSVDFVSSPGASGLFGVYAMPSPWSEWTSASDEDDGRREFTNLSASGQPVRVGEVRVDTSLPVLRAGDADRDLDFDQFDLIRVLKAAKYRSGQPATWGEGDWNGAPGGHPGAPPVGNGRFDQFDIIAAQQAAIYKTGPYAANQSVGGLFATASDSDGSWIGEGYALEVVVSSESDPALLSQVSMPVAHLQAPSSGTGVAAVPEPSAGLLLSIALLYFAFSARRGHRPSI